MPRVPFLFALSLLIAKLSFPMGAVPSTLEESDFT